MRAKNGGHGVDIAIDALGPGALAETFLHAIGALARGSVAVDIGGMRERPGLDLFAMMCRQQSVLGSLWFTTGEAQQEMPTPAAAAPWTCRSSSTTSSRWRR